MTTSSFQSKLDQAMAASAAGESALALALFGEAALAEPQSGLPSFLMASEYAALGDYDQAEAHFANAVLLAPRFSLARYQLGFLQYTLGRPALALVTWQPLLSEESGPFALCVQGFAALAQDRFEDARVFFLEGIDRNAENPAMSDDIRKIVADIEKIHAGDLSQRKSEDESQSDADTSHFLLSNYRQQGGIH